MNRGNAQAGRKEAFLYGIKNDDVVMFVSYRHWQIFIVEMRRKEAFLYA
jgi:hypothetical protein